MAYLLMPLKGVIAIPSPRKTRLLLGSGGRTNLPNGPTRLSLSPGFSLSIDLLKELSGLILVVKSKKSSVGEDAIEKA